MTKPRAIIINGKEYPPSDIALVLLYPEAYERIKNTDGSESYVERLRHNRGGDKDFWVEAKEVDAWRKDV